MNVYLAADFRNQLLMKIVREFLKEQVPGINITSRWIDQGDRLLPLKDRAEIDYQDIDDSCLLVCFYPLAPTGGAISEMAYCLGSKKKFIYVIEKKLFPGLDDHRSDPLPVGLLTQYTGLSNLNTVDNGYIIHTVGDLCDCLRWYSTNII